MSENQNQNSGALFPNDKGDNPKRPDFRGDVTIAGTKYWVSAWKKTDKRGKGYLSLALTVATEENKEAAEGGALPF